MDVPYPLTPIQIQILEMASDGLTDKEISHKLGIAPGTLRTYWDRMRKRCDSRSRSEVIAKMQHGLSPKRLRLILLEKMPFFIWTFNSKGKLEYCNEWFATVGGMTRKEALRYGMAPLISPEERERYVEFVSKGLKSGQTFEEVWHLAKTSDDPKKLHKIRMFPLNQLGQPGDQWIAYCREIAQDADQAMSKFLIGILS